MADEAGGIAWRDIATCNSFHSVDGYAFAFISIHEGKQVHVRSYRNLELSSNHDDSAQIHTILFYTNPSLKQAGSRLTKAHNLWQFVLHPHVIMVLLIVVALLYAREV